MQPVGHLVRHKLRLQGARGNPPQGREQHRRRLLDLGQHGIDQPFGGLFTGRIGDHETCQRSEFHHLVLIARSFQPRILLIDVEIVVRRRGTRISGFCLAFEWMLGRLVISVFIPGPRNILGYLFRRKRLHRRDVAFSNHSGGEEERRRVVHALVRKVSVG